MRWIGIDIGTTHVKAIAIEGDAAVASATELTPTESTGEGAYRDIAGVVTAVKRVITRVTETGTDETPVAAISVASMGEEIVPIGVTGASVAPVLAWFDRRGEEEAQRFPLTRLHQRFPPDPTWSLFKLLWLGRRRPDDLARTVQLTDVGSFVLHELGSPIVMDWSHASRTAMFDPIATCWDEETIDRASLNPRWLPELVPSGTVIGTIADDVAAELRLPRTTLLVAGGHDHFVGAFGCGIRSGGDYYISAGTSEAQLVLTDEPIEPEAGIDQGRFVDNTHWYVHCAVASGHLYGQWRHLLYGAEEDSVVASEVACEPSPVHARVELETTTRSATLRDVPLVAGRALIMRSVIEGAAVASADVFNRLSARIPDRVSRLVAAGHAGDDHTWRSLRLGLMQRPIDLVIQPEVTAVGAALLARRGVTGDAEPFATTRRFDPGPLDLERAEALSALYRAAETVGVQP